MGKGNLFTLGICAPYDSVQRLELHGGLLLRHLHAPDDNHGLGCLVGEAELYGSLDGGLVERLRIVYKRVPGFYAWGEAPGDGVLSLWFLVHAC